MVMELAAPRALKPNRSSVLLLLSLNFMLLAFFIMLNSVASQPGKPAEDAVLRRTAAGQPGTAKLEGPGGESQPVQGEAWQDRATRDVQGVLLNTIPLRTIPLQANANQLVLELPLRVLATPSVLQAIQRVTAQEWAVVWQVQGGDALQVATAWQAVGAPMRWLPAAPQAPTEEFVRLTLIPQNVSAGATVPMLQRKVEEADGRALGEQQL
jgi:hypothetical protein